jgi:hypothetical protein
LAVDSGGPHRPLKRRLDAGDVAQLHVRALRAAHHANVAERLRIGDFAHPAQRDLRPAHLQVARGQIQVARPHDVRHPPQRQPVLFELILVQQDVYLAIAQTDQPHPLHPGETPQLILHVHRHPPQHLLVHRRVRGVNPNLQQRHDFVGGQPLQDRLFRVLGQIGDTVEPRAQIVERGFVF